MVAAHHDAEHQTGTTLVIGDPLKHQFRNQMIDSVRPFTFKEKLISWPGENDELFAAIRKFYLLLPSRGLEEDWRRVPKHHRRSQIRDHLVLICEESSITVKAIDVVDRWLTNIGAPRIPLSVYGRLVEEKFGTVCFICGRKIDDQKTLDHVLPLSRGGVDEVDNYRLAHRGCNSAKNNLLIGDQITWAPANLETSVPDIPSRLRYLVFLRDDFSCTTYGCEQGLHTRHQLSLRLKHESGIACYDNLQTQCEDCSKKEE